MFFLFRFAFVSEADFNDIKKVCERYKGSIIIFYYTPFDKLKTYEIIIEVNKVKNTTFAIMKKIQKYNEELKRIVKPHIWNDRVVNHVSNFEYKLIMDMIEKDVDDDLGTIVIFNKNENKEGNVMQVLNKEEKEKKEKETKPLSGISFRWQLDSECKCDDFINMKAK